MKVLIISSLYPPIGRGGAEKAASLLAESLVLAGDDVVVVTLHPGKEEVLEERNGVRIYRLPLANFYWPFGRKVKAGACTRLLWHARDIWNTSAAKRIARILDEEKPEVVNTHVLAGFSVAVWQEVKKRKIKLVHTMHDYYLLCIRSSMFSNGSICKNRCVGCRAATRRRKRWSEKLDEVVSVSEYVLEIHKKARCFGNAAQSVIYNVIDSGKPESRPRNDSTVEPLVFGYIGKIEEAKGIRSVLEATGLLSQPNWRLRIAGDGLEPFVSELKEQFSDRRIEWLGFTGSEAFYRSIDVSVIPSIWADPLPYVVVETIAAGKALICSDAGGIPELACLGSVTQVFPAGNVTKLAKAMDQALANKAAWQSGGFKEEWMKNLFSAEAIVSQYRAKYTTGK